MDDQPNDDAFERVRDEMTGEAGARMFGAETAQEPAGARASTNGKGPAHPADLEHQMRLTLSALESVDMRLANIQATNLMLFGAIVLVFALELRIFKAVGGE